MVLESALDSLESLRVAEDVLRHSPRPAMDAGQKGLGGDSKQSHLGASEREKLDIGVGGHVPCAEAAGVNPHQHRPIGSALGPLP